MTPSSSLLAIRPAIRPTIRRWAPTLVLVLFLGPVLVACEVPEPDPEELVETPEDPYVATPDDPGAETPAPEAGVTEAQQVFWERLEALCGQAFEGRPLEAPEDSDWWEAERMVMHVRECDDDEIRIPLHVDDDRSRTWVVTRTEHGLQLKHDHRLEDGSPDTANTDYGGHTGTGGSIWRQEFPADEYSVEAVPGRESQLWYLEIRPGDAFYYGLRREATGLRYRVEFDLTRPVDAPPAPWGAEGTS